MAHVESVLGEAVVRATSQVEGFSPGSADRVATTSGRRAFVTGRYFDKDRLPAPPNMPTLRAFQYREAIAGMDWLRERWA